MKVGEMGASGDEFRRADRSLGRRVDALSRYALGGAAGVALLAGGYIVVEGPGLDSVAAAVSVAGLLLFAVVLLLASRLGSARRANVVLLVLGVVGGGYGAEIMARVVTDLSDGADSVDLADCRHFTPILLAQCEAALRVGRPFDARHGVEVAREIEAERPGERVVAYVLPATRGALIAGTDSVLALSGVSRALTVLCSETGEFEVYRSDEHGFRNQEAWESSTGGIVLIGDSFTHGFCVGDEETVAGHLRTTHSRVLNLGFVGSGPLKELATLKEYGLRASPEVVVWLYYEGNDPEDLEAEKRIPFFVRYLAEGPYQDLYHRRPLLDRLLLGVVEARTEDAERMLAAIARAEEEEAAASDRGSCFGDLLLGFLTLGHVRQVIVESLDRSPPPDFPFDSELFRQSIAAATDAVHEADADLLFVYLPEYDRYTRQRVVPHKAEVLATVRELGVPVIDMDSVFSLGDPLAAFPNRLRGHYSTEGYRLVAQAIGDWLERR